MRRFLPAPPERNSVLMTLGAAFFVGCRLAAYLSDGAWQWVLCALGVALIPLLRRAGMRSTAALFLIALSLGILRTQACLYPVQPLAGKYELTGYVYGEPRSRADGRLNFTLTRVTLNGKAQPGRAYCTAYEHGQALPMLFDGATLRFVGRVYLPEGKSGMHRFDFRQWMLQNGMSYGVVISKGIEVCGTPETAPWMDVASRMRTIFRNALRRVMGEEARVATALLLSDREGIAEEETKAFQALGIAHVMAVSGLHVGLLGGVLLALLDALSVRRKRQLPIVALFLAGYCALTGFSAASMRAAVMMLGVLGARLLTRAPDALTSLATAALVVLLATPLQAYSAGFVLSFSAVLGIVLLNPVFLGLCNRWLPRWRGNIYARRSPARRMLDWLSRHFGTPRQLLCLSLSAQLGVLLPTAIYFHQLPLYGVLVNLLVIPYMGVLVPACALALLCSPIPLLGMGVGAVAAALVRLLLWAVELLSALPGASVRVAAAPMMIVAGGAAVALICSRRMRGGMGRKALAALLVGVLAVAGTYVARPAELRYVQLSVGRGDASLLLDGDQTIVVDVGSDGLAVLDYLLAEGRDIDALYLTHLHLDHVGGVRALLDGGIRIRQAYLPVNAREQQLESDSLAVVSELCAAGVPVAELGAGDERRYGTAGIRVLWPMRETVRRRQDANDLPLVLAIDFGGYVILSTSDITGHYEAYAAEPCDLLKVAHHGSGDSSSDAFLSFVRPRVALVSCSSTNKRLPSPDTLARLGAHGVLVCRTDQCGDITMTIKGGQLCVTPYKARISN